MAVKADAAQHGKRSSRTARIIFTVLHRMQGCLVARKVSVHPSVCLSVKRMNCDKTEEKSVQIFIPYERPFNLIFWKKNGWWDNPFYRNFWVYRPRWRKIADFQPIFARSASAV